MNCDFVIEICKIDCFNMTNFQNSPICMYPLRKILTSKKIKRTCLSIFEKQHDLRRIFTCFYFPLDNIYKTCYNIHKLFLVLFHGNLKDIIHRGPHHHFYPNVLPAPTSQGTPSCAATFYCLAYLRLQKPSSAI